MGTVDIPKTPGRGLYPYTPIASAGFIKSSVPELITGEGKGPLR